MELSKKKVPEWNRGLKEKGTLSDESAQMKLKLGVKWNFRRRKCPNGTGNRRKRELSKKKVPK
ncbi:hypothetical protein CD30_07405 [Ureibacillus massiliensis 4400831 = CIP 108448 = CCUG 49529]|uniref:Uncharacterized protein n=1 Tax=Ureibacillus massiliensis 4400831 = CIP 108448 = CCUG 49529 TaxID=1211035 RepID=A0A0A3J7X8_9BACL|nr:hypothetical protein CD30_07405 [Ureibacillus massiliensis 4400831 = CIP 108448 = CCUG 49529]